MTTDDDVALFSGWMAGSPGALQAFINARTFDIEIVPEGSDDPVFEIEGKAVRDYWVPAELTDEEIAGWVGVSPKMKAPISGAFWIVPVPKLAPGTYFIEADFGMTHKLTDLGDYYMRDFSEGSDHKPDLYPPFVLSGSNTIELVVTAP